MNLDPAFQTAMFTLWLGVTLVVAFVGLAFTVVWTLLYEPNADAEWGRKWIRNSMLAFSTSWAWPVWVAFGLSIVIRKNYRILRGTL